MRYIKTYESSYQDKKYWLIPTIKPFLEMSLKDIGVSPKEIKSFLEFTHEDNKIWLLKDEKIFPITTTYWSWMPVNNNIKSDIEYLEKEGFEYMGELYDYATDSNKYNL